MSFISSKKRTSQAMMVLCFDRIHSESLSFPWDIQQRYLPKIGPTYPLSDLCLIQIPSNRSSSGCHNSAIRLFHFSNEISSSKALAGQARLRSGNGIDPETHCQA